MVFGCHPYQIGELCADVENGEFKNVALWDRLQHQYTFKVQQFVSDLCKLGVVFEYYDALQKAEYEHNASAGRELYYEGRFRDSLPFFWNGIGRNKRMRIICAVLMRTTMS